MTNVVDIDSARAPLGYALRYAAKGWHVLPIWPGTKQPIGHLVRNGHLDATVDEAIINQWWTSHPDAGIGIAMLASRMVTIDVDPRNGGLYSMEQLEAEHGPLASDVLAYTGGGGEHRVFSCELAMSLPGKLGPGVDVKADGYIVVEPSIHPSGKAYAWEASSDPLSGAVPSTLPGWVRDLSRRPLDVPADYVAPARTVEPARLAAAQKALPHIECESRDAWLRVGMSVHNEMPGPDGFDLWATWSQRSAKYDPQDQLRVWRSFKARGLAGVGLNTVFAMAQGSGWRNVGNVTTINSAIAPPADLLLDVLELDARSSATRWAVKGMVPDSSLGMIFGASGTFKSFIALDYALHRAWNLPWCGRRTAPGSTPIFLAAEGGSGLIRRIKAWHLAHGMDWRACTLRVIIVPLLMLRQAPAMADAIDAAGLQPSDVIIDTMSQTFDGNENAADEVSSYLRTIRTNLVDRFHGCTVTVIHHCGHGSTERPRGSSSLQANVDFLFGVFRQGDESMISTVECQKVKDGEKFTPVDFLLTSHSLGKDEDGDPITSLAASFVDNAQAILTADAGKREGHRQLLLRLAGALIDEREVRKAFDSEHADLQDSARRQAWKRARDWAVSNGLVAIHDGRFEVLNPVFEAQS